MKKQILFELNEVPFSVIDFYCQQHPGSNLAKILPQSSQYETYTEDEGHLSPWITWPTLHRGVIGKDHGINDFGQDLTNIDKKYPPVWKKLMESGVKTGVFASMHSYPLPANYKDYAFYVPDPFAGDSRTHPENIIPFQKFNLAMSRKSGRNVDTGVDMKSAAGLALSLPSLGIKPGTMADVAGQLVTERVKPWARTRRRTYQSVLAFDVFMKLMRTRKPQFTTYFSNHVASAMHRYWAATFPDHYSEYELSDEWKTTYREEIDFTMTKFDEFLGNLIRFTEKNPGYQLIITSSMGQEATEAKKLKTESYCNDLSKFMGFFGITEKQWEPRPAMHPQYNLMVKPEKIAEFRNKLSSIKIDSKDLSFREKENGFFSIDLGHRNLNVDYFELDGQKIPFGEIGVSNEPIEDETGSTAYHIPEGSLIIYDPDNKENANTSREKVTTRAFFPSILENFHIELPDYVTEQRIKEIT